MWGSQGSGQSQFTYPTGICGSADGLVYVADINNHRVQVFNGRDGSFVRMWGSQGSGQSQFNNPEGICFSADGLVYVADNGNHRVQVFN